MDAATTSEPASAPVEQGAPSGVRPSSEKWLCLPREHGSWGMLLFPFLAGALLGRNPTIVLIPALLAALAAFLAREPILVLWRKRPERAAARRTLLLCGLTLAVSGLWLLFELPFAWLAALGAMAAVLTAIHVRAVVHRRQHSVPLQVVGAAGLTSSAVLAYLSAGRQPDTVLMLLWGG